jgi:hypothetical protein
MPRHTGRWLKRRYLLAVSVVVALAIGVMTLSVWVPPAGWLLATHLAIRHALGWLHAHWLNAPAITALGTILLALVGLTPLYIWHRDRSGRKIARNTEQRETADRSPHDSAAGKNTLVIHRETLGELSNASSSSPTSSTLMASRLHASAIAFGRFVNQYATGQDQSVEVGDTGLLQARIVDLKAALKLLDDDELKGCRNRSFVVTVRTQRDNAWDQLTDLLDALDREEDATAELHQLVVSLVQISDLIQAADIHLRQRRPLAQVSKYSVRLHLEFLKPFDIILPSIR